MTRTSGLREIAAGVAWLREQGWAVDDITQDEELVARGVDGEGEHEIALPLGAPAKLPGWPPKPTQRDRRPNPTRRDRIERVR
jgi:hypothetical protein